MQLFKRIKTFILKSLARGQPYIPFGRSRGNVNLQSQTQRKTIVRIAKQLSLIEFDYFKKSGEGAESNYENIYSGDIANILVRPNPKLTPTEFWEAYFMNLYEFGNAIIVPIYNNKNEIDYLELLDMSQWSFGLGYTKKGNVNMMILKNGLTGNTSLLPYDYIIHQRLEADQYFSNELANRKNQAIQKIIDTQLSVLLEELESNFEIKGVFKIGGAGVYSASAVDEKSKRNKIKEIEERVKSSLLVLDSTEDYKELTNTYKKLNKEDFEYLEKMSYSIYGVSKPFVDGTANYADLTAFYNNIAEPRIKSLQEEINYKLLSKTALTQGKKISVRINRLSGATIEEITKLISDGIYGGWACRNDARRILGWAPVNGGDVFTGNANMRNPDGTKID